MAAETEHTKQQNKIKSAQIPHPEKKTHTKNKVPLKKQLNTIPMTQLNKIKKPKTVALKPVDINKMSSKDSGASTADNEKKTKQQDLQQLTLLEKSHLKQLAKRRKEVILILEILKDTISKNYSNYSPIISMLMSKELKQKIKNLDKELKGLKTNNENNLNFLQNSTFKKISNIIKDEINKIRNLISDVKTETKKFFILNRDKFKWKLQEEVIECKNNTLKAQKQKYFSVYVDYLTKNSKIMSTEKKKELYTHLLVTKNFMMGVFSSKKSFSTYSVDNLR